ncbi:porphobilinogen deaminase [Acidianus hospitalis W1]|uniref:Hydroxymethylbilane synthase n=1 Tax=Acidianus hospitalis (strain W1) TaxID=933801 RepID=F4B725_ACIHW|nr:hydroxymethylbilane synthase [Acidianus hospitalis]AEE93508.1 porphobilinogen deaminase [Acidianus hospitalis W1]
MIRIAARNSQLSQVQVKVVSDYLNKLGYETEFIGVKTKADLFVNEPLYKLGKGVFEKEVNEYVIRGLADLAVHSMKDLTSNLSEELDILATVKRDSPYDVLVSKKDVFDLDSGSVIGTSSIRRKNFMTFLRPDILVKDLRGNIDTRIKKYTSGEYVGIIIAEASILRLNLNINYFKLNPIDFTPEANQGIIAVVGKKNDERTRKLLSELHDQETFNEAIAERSTMEIVGGGCHSPFGVYFEQIDDRLLGIASFSNGKKKITVTIERKGNPKDVGHELGKLLLGEMKNENLIP